MPSAIQNVNRCAQQTEALETARGATLTWGAAVEAIGFWALILVYMWWIEPVAPLVVRLASLLLLGLVPVTSVLLHHERPSEIGFGLTGLRRSALEVGVATLGSALVIGAVAVAAKEPPRFALHSPWVVPGYLVWGLLQQFALQAFVHRRLRQALGRPRLAALAAALLFGAVHLPNPVLAPAATLGGWIWCRLYARTPNLWTLAVSHAVLAGLVLWLLPPTWVHDLKVGPGYWTWR